jgi:GNAT superfamily N-acetyltransferase
MDPATEYFASTCSHTGESEEADVAGRRQLQWLLARRDRGLRIKVALYSGEPAGMLHFMPIEVSPHGPLGEEMGVVTCLFVTRRFEGKGIGRELMDAAEEEARRQGLPAIAAVAYYWDFWFMPASFFEKFGYVVTDRAGETAVLWKVLSEEDRIPAPPKLVRRRYSFVPVSGKVGVDLFFTDGCQTSNIEGQRVREVAGSFGDRVVLREYDSSDRDALLKYGVPRAIFVDGREIGWGYEAPREGIREAIEKALKEHRV